MALIDFLKNCKSVLSEEANDFRRVCSRLEHSEDFFTALMPMEMIDFEPIYLLENTEARRFTQGNGHIYIIPIKKNSLHSFAKILEAWYFHDELPSDRGFFYGAELDETIVLYSDDVKDNMTLQSSLNINVVYARLYFNFYPVHTIWLADASIEAWKNVIEPHKIHIDILIDAAKGLPSWFEDTLYPEMINTPYPEILPKYYFKGEYISHEAPEKFSLLYTVPAKYIRKGATEIPREIYSTKWD